MLRGAREGPLQPDACADLLDACAALVQSACWAAKTAAQVLGLCGGVPSPVLSALANQQVAAAEVRAFSHLHGHEMKPSLATQVATAELAFELLQVGMACSPTPPPARPLQPTCRLSHAVDAPLMPLALGSGWGPPWLGAHVLGAHAARCRRAGGTTAGRGTL